MSALPRKQTSSGHSKTSATKRRHDLQMKAARQLGRLYFGLRGHYPACFLPMFYGPSVHQLLGAAPSET